ncbi:DNA primase [Lacunisphaera limnophila]|uniref:DNA primase n=1 Tax=Lacunisphaera limnophila TaxID=1838286 RepID=A0A1D8AWD1_9BACT|nr:DNA primase [Lacunisphaera limnophila]AOS45208.1 DNA primase [Lacunisphaera limnophila]
MPVIKANSLRDLKNRVNIHDVVIRVVALKKAGGGRFKGLCPFHAEKTPSFNVSADKGFFKCFGCGKAGDAINFVMETEGLPFTEAVEAIAQRSGFTLEYEEGSGGPSKETRSLRQEIFDIHDLAADFYRHAFLAPTPHGDFIRDYWVQNRKFAPELAEEFKIGFAPVDDTGLAAVMLKRKFSEDALRQCGLFFIRDGAIPTLGVMRPRFRGRLMIPIRDHQGRIVAFTARQLTLTPQDDASHEAKYVNSPETPIFTKSNLLFNLDRARSHAGEGHPFVLVEGQLDALRCWSVGLKTAIAPQGTSITEGQLALLKRYHAQVECFFDSDSAGQKAALRFLPMALKAGLEVRFLTLAGAAKLDPDLLFLEKGLTAYDEVRRGALAAMPFARQAFLPEPTKASFNERMQAVRSMVEIALQAETQVARDDYLQQVSLLLGVQPDAIRSEVAILEKRRYTGGKDPAAPTPSTHGETHTKGYEEHLLYVCLHNEALLHDLSTHLAHEWIDTTGTAGLLLDKLLAEVLHNGWQGRETLDQLLESEEEKSLAATLLFQTPGEEDWVKIANEGLRHLQKRFLEPKKQQIELEIASKGAIGDPTLPSLLKQRAAITRQLLNPPKLSLAS